MITVTPLRQTYTRRDQARDELQCLLLDLEQHPTDYLSHPNLAVRNAAEWTLEWYKIRETRHAVPHDPKEGEKQLIVLYHHLRRCAA